MSKNNLVKINPTIVLSELTELEKDYYEFQKMDRSFNGWILTLNEMEFRELMVDFKLYKGKKAAAPPKYGILEYIFDGRTTFDNEEFKENLVMKGDHLKKISLCKDGWMNYTVAKEDKNWVFKITPAGQQQVDARNKKKQDS